MSKKGFLASLIIAIVATVSLSVYTVLSVCLPEKTPNSPSTPKETTVSLAFRSGETVSQLTGCVENEDLTFSLEEGKENPLEFVEADGSYVAKDMNSSVTAIVKNDDGTKTNYNISVYHHNNGFAQDGVTPIAYSETEPFIVATRAHLEELRTKINEDVNPSVSTVSYVSLVADIDLGAENWMPIGLMGKEAKGLTFEGNNHTIKNLVISVTSDNYLDYIQTIYTQGKNVGFMDLGLFGSMKSTSAVSNLKFEGASISITKEVYEILKDEPVEEADFDVFSIVSIGVLSGRAVKTNIDNVSVQASIKGFSFVNTDELIYDVCGVGGIVGGGRNVQFTNSQTDVKFTETGIHGTTEAENASENATDFGGIIGVMYTFGYEERTAEWLESTKNKIENCSTSVSATIYYQNRSYIAGLVGVADNADILNSTVKKMKVVDPTHISDALDLNYCVAVGGAIGKIRNNSMAECDAGLKQKLASSIKNVKVENLYVDMVKGVATGLVSATSMTDDCADTTIEIVDSSVSGYIHALRSAGISDKICARTNITYTENFTGKAIDLTISAKTASAIATFSEGSVKGYARTLEEGKTERTVVDVKFNGLGNKLLSGANTEVAYSNTYSSGFGEISQKDGEAAPVVEDLCFNYSSTSSLSFSGVAHFSYGAQIKNCDIKANVVSYNYKKTDSNDVVKNFSTTYMVGGVVANALANTLVEGVSVDIVVNKNVPADEERGFAFFGGVVARIHSNNVTVRNCSVVADVYSNHIYDRGIEITDTHEDIGKIFLAGGVVGSIQKYEGAVGVDGLTPILSQADVDAGAKFNVVIENNTVNFSIIADFDAEEVGTLGENGHRVRAVGALVGNVNSYMKVGDKLDLSTNTVESYKLKADKDAFTYGYQRGETLVKVNTIGLKVENDDFSDTIDRAYGISFLLHTGNSEFVKNPDTINAEFENLDE